MTKIEDLPVDGDTKSQLEEVQNRVNNHSDMKSVEFYEDGLDIRIEAVYDGHPVMYHYDIRENGYSAGLDILEEIDDTGIGLPVDDPKTGVITDHSNEEVKIINYQRNVMSDGGVLLPSVTAIGPIALAALPFIFAGLVDLGEEYMIKNSMETSFDIGLYNDTTDSLGDTNDLSDITTEPGGAAYSRQTESFSAADISGDWGIDNDNQISFDLSDSSSGSVDSWFAEINFTAVDTSDGGGTDHLLWFGSLSQSYTLSSVDTFNIAGGDAELTVS